MNKFIYLFAILGCLALATAQIAEPDLSEEAGILTPFENDLPVDGDSDYFKNGEDYGGIYEGVFENAEGFVGAADDINDDFGYVEDPIVAEEFVGLVDVPEPFGEEGDATIGEAVVEPSEDPFQFNQIPNSALDSEAGEDFYESWEAIVDTPDDIISEEDFVDYPDALTEFEEEAAVDEPEALVDFEEGAVGEPEAFIDLEEGLVGLPDDLVDFEAGETDYPDALVESGEDDFEALVDYPDNLVESGEDVFEALVDYPDNLVESGEDLSEAFVDEPSDDFGEADYPEDEAEGEVDEPEAVIDSGEADDEFGEADYPEDEAEGEVDEPEAVIDSVEVDDDFGEADYPEDEAEDEEIGFAIDAKPVVELDPRVLDTDEEESTIDDSDDQGYMAPEEETSFGSNDVPIEPDNVEQGDILVAEGIDEVAAEPAAEEESKNFLG